MSPAAADEEPIRFNSEIEGSQKIIMKSAAAASAA
jgi:hypothetical protein